MALVVRTRDWRRPAATGLGILVVATAYYVAGRLGLREEVVVGGVRVTPLWPPTGIAVAGLLLLGWRILPGIALGALGVIASLGSLNPSVVGLVAGSTVAPACAYLLLRWVRFRSELDRLRDGIALVFLGALAAMTISSSADTLVLFFSGALPPHQYWPTWTAWWTGDAMGVLVVAPVLLAVRAVRWPRWAPLYRWAEALVLLAVTVAVMLIATRTSLNLIFLVFPLVMWAALRFQLLGAAPCVLLVSVLAVPSAVEHTGPFAGHGLLAVMVVLQALNGAAALTGLLLSAMITERNDTHRQIQLAVNELTEVVARLAPGENHRRLPPDER